MLKIGQELKKEMIKFSIVAVFNNGISQLLYYYGYIFNRDYNCR